MAGSSSSGWLSNLPLANKSRSLKDRKEGGRAITQSPSRGVLNPEIEVNDQGDEGLWYDCTSSEGSLSPVKSFADIENSHVSVKSTTPEEEAELLPHMPSLFGLDLPPCNADIQVAYENVVNRLRVRWLNQRGSIGTVDLCHAVKTELSNQNFMFPAFSIKGPFKKRKPWRRENVFKYELRWIDYFVKEAQAQSPDLMTESELMERRKESSAPAALGFNLGDRPDVRKLWDEWNAKMRAKTLAMPERDTNIDTGLAAGSPEGNVLKETNGNAKESNPDSTDSMDSDITLVQPKTEGKPDDAHLWSQGGHD